MKTILVTGAAGFIGSNFVRWVLHHDPSVRLIAFDKLTYAGNLANLTDLLSNPRLVFVRGDICDATEVNGAVEEHDVEEIVNFAAESHVDRSILSSGPFISTNVGGTQVLLDIARQKSIARFLQVSTDEVYGSLPENRPDLKFTEDTPLAPNSPYSASKAAADFLVRSYVHTFNMPAIITRCSNNYGPYQFPEKVIPLFITNLLEGRKVPLYGDGLNVRDWLYVEDHCEALWAVLRRGKVGEVYNIGGDNEISNRSLTETLLREMGKSWDTSVQYVKDRPGHDRRYAIDASKIHRELGWSPRQQFPDGLRKTIQWYLANAPWWQAIRSGEYLMYYQTQYGDR